MSIPETVSGESRAMNVTLLTERRKTIIKDIAELTNEYFSANELGAMRNIDASKPSTAELKTNVENYQSTHFFTTWEYQPDTRITIEHMNGGRYKNAFALIRIDREYEGGSARLKIIQHSSGECVATLDLIAKKKIENELSVTFKIHPKSVTVEINGNCPAITKSEVEAVFGDLDVAKLETSNEYANEQYSRFRKELFNW